MIEGRELFPGKSLHWRKAELTFSSVGKVCLLSTEFLRSIFFLPSFAGRRGWSVWLVLDLPVNQIHQESVAEEIKIKQQWGTAGAKKRRKRGHCFLYVAPIWSCGVLTFFACKKPNLCFCYDKFSFLSEQQKGQLPPFFIYLRRPRRR